MIRLLFIFLLCTTVSYMRGQQALVKHYRLNDKNVAVNINAIVQDSVGYLWLGTDLGLVRYNGLEFVPVPDNLGLKISALSIIGNRLYIGYENGALASLKNMKIVAEDLASYTGQSPITKILSDREGNFCLGTDNGLWIANHEEAQYISTDQGLSDPYIYDLHLIRQGTLIASTDRGISMFRYEPRISAMKTTDIKDGLSDNITSALCFSGINDKYWIGTHSAGICMLDIGTGTIVKHPANDNWKWGTVRDIKVSGPGSALAVTDKGYVLELTYIDHTTIHITEYADAGTPINCLFIDQAGNAWCGTAQGLTLILTKSLSYIPLKSPYQLDKVTAMAWSGDSTLWIGMDNELYKMDIGRHVKDLRKVWEGPAPISYLYTDRNNHLWIGTIRNGLWQKSEQGIRHIQIHGSNETSVLCIAERQDELWIGGLNGIYVLDKNRQVLHHFDKSSGIGSDYIYYLYTSSDHHIWVASDGGGVSMYDGINFNTWTRLQEGSASVAYCITEDIHGDIWYGDMDGTLHRYRDGTWSHFINERPVVKGSELSVLTSNINIPTIAVFRDRIDFTGEKYSVHWHFIIANWFTEDHFSNVLNCFTKDMLGNIYLPISSGLLIIGNRKTDVLPIQNVVIHKITNNGNVVSGMKQKFKAGENYFTFLFDAVFYGDSKKYYYRYKLTGNNNSWIYSNINLATFSNLPPGKYSFIVEASSDEYFHNISRAAYHFEILLPFWRSWWFITLAIITVLSSVFLYNRIRIRNLKKIAAIEHEKLFFEYEYLRSQINPHFLFNSLNTLMAVIDEHPEKAIAYTEKLSDFYRNTINHLDQGLIPIYQELEILDNYMQIQQYRFGDSLQIKIKLNEQQKRVKVVPMVFQLLVENAIKHNAFSAKEPLIVSIRIQAQDILVSNKINLKRQVVKASKLGLTNIEKRYKIYTNKRIAYGEHNGYWIVRLPIID